MTTTDQTGVDRTLHEGVHVERAGDAGDVRIAVGSRLDGRSGHMLLQAADAVAASGGERITVDLRRVDGFTEDGVAAATACCRLASGLPGGVSFVASAGPSRRALLAILDRG